MTNELPNSNAGMQRTRRNLMKMGAIAVPATLATVQSAKAWCLLGIIGQCDGNGDGDGNGDDGNGNGARARAIVS